MKIRFTFFVFLSCSAIATQPATSPPTSPANEAVRIMLGVVLMAMSEFAQQIRWNILLSTMTAAAAGVSAAYAYKARDNLNNYIEDPESKALTTACLAGSIAFSSITSAVAGLTGIASCGCGLAFFACSYCFMIPLSVASLGGLITTSIAFGKQDQIEVKPIGTNTTIRGSDDSSLKVSFATSVVTLPLSWFLVWQNWRFISNTETETHEPART